MNESYPKTQAEVEFFKDDEKITIEVYDPTEVLKYINNHYSPDYGDWLDINLNKVDSHNPVLLGNLFDQIKNLNREIEFRNKKDIPVKKLKRDTLFVLRFIFDEVNNVTLIQPGLYSIINGLDGLNIQFEADDLFFVSGKLRAADISNEDFDIPAESLFEFTPRNVCDYSRIPAGIKIGIPYRYFHDIGTVEQRDKDNELMEKRAEELQADIIYHEANPADLKAGYSYVFEYKQKTNINSDNLD